MSKNKEQILELAEKHALELDRNTLEINESGLDFQVAFAKDANGKEWALRIPRRLDVFARTKPEKKALDFINRHVDFEAPDWEIYTEDLIAYKKLTGVPAGTIDMEIQNYIFEIDEKNVPINFIETLGEAMVSLHSISTEKAVEAGIKVQTPEALRENMSQRMDKVKQQYGVSDELWNRWQEWLGADDMWPEETALIHGDLHPGHIIIDDKANVTGLIDWTEAQVADISKDFMGHHRVFGEAGLVNLINAYKAAGGYHWPKMKEHIIELNAAFPIDVAEYAIESGQKEYEEMAKKGLGVENK